MKLEKFEEKKTRKIGIVLLGTLSLIAIGYLVSKTYAVYQEKKDFRIMEGTFDYFQGSDVYFAFYQNDEQVSTMPTKESGLSFKRAECTNGANIYWNGATWEPTIKGLTKSKTKCTLYFGETTFSDLVLACSQGGKSLSTCMLENASEDRTNLAFDGTTENNLRYIGANPNNYVSFNGELWRIIGVMNHIDDGSGSKTSRIKLIRSESIGKFAWDSNNVNNWNIASLQTNLNSGTWETWKLSNEAKSLVKNAVWNLGGTSSSGVTSYFPSQIYEYERGTLTYGTNLISWTGTVGLMYPSDYGFAVGGIDRETCLTKDLYHWNDTNNENCKSNNWLYDNEKTQWTMMPVMANSIFAIFVHSRGYVDQSYATQLFAVRPTVFLDPNIKIYDGNGSKENPYILKI